MRGLIYSVAIMGLVGAALAGCAKPASSAAAAPQAPGSSCSAPANQVCDGCSVSCPAGKQAMCKPGQLTSGDNPACWNLAVCGCQ